MGVPYNIIGVCLLSWGSNKNGVASCIGVLPLGLNLLYSLVRDFITIVYTSFITISLYGISLYVIYLFYCISLYILLNISYITSSLFMKYIILYFSNSDIIIHFRIVIFYTFHKRIYYLCLSTYIIHF